MIKAIVYSVNYLCDTRCTMCNIWRRYLDAPQLINKELNLEEVRKIFLGSESLKHIDTVLLGGGEPFLKKDFVDLCLFFYEWKPQVRLFTGSNGRNTRLIIEKLKSLKERLSRRNLKDKIIHIGFSVDGSENTHDRMRGVQGIFRNVINTINEAKQIESVNVSVSFTITPLNYKEFLQVYDLSNQLNVGFGFRFGQNSRIYYNNEQTDFLWNQEQLNEIESMISKIKKTLYSDGSLLDKFLDIKPYFYEKMVPYQRQPKRMHRCLSGTISCFLDPYGNLYPCIMLDRPIGNVRKQDFDSLWRSDKARVIRRFILKKGCHCYSGCDLPTSLPYNIAPYFRNVSRFMRKRFFSHCDSNGANL